jgi:hypothetical protein
VFAEIRKLDVQRQKDPVFTGRAGRYLDIRAGQQALIRRGQHVVAQIGQRRLEMAGQVFVELEFHAPTAVFQSPS